MKRKLLSTTIVVLLSVTLGGCAGGKSNADPSPTATPTPVVTPSPVVTQGVEPTAEPTVEPTATPEPTATVAPTTAPEPTATPMPTATPEPTATPSPTATPMPTATPKPTATPIPTPAGEIIENVVSGTFPRTGTVVSDGLNVRKDAGASYDVVTVIVKNTRVSILSAKQVKSGTYWYQISFTKNGEEYTGYVNSKYVAVDYLDGTEIPEVTVTPIPTTAPEVTATPKPTATPTAAPKPTATPTAMPKPTDVPAATPTPEPTVIQSESISAEEVVDSMAFFLYQAEIQKDMVELKSDFGSDAKVIAKLPKKTPVIVINQSKTEDGSWYRIAIKQNGVVIYGYVTSENVKLLASVEMPVAAQIIEDKVRLRNMASETGSYIRDKEGELIALSLGDYAWIIGEVSGQNLSEKWFELVVEIDGEVYTGYVQEAPVYLMEMVTEAPVVPNL